MERISYKGHFIDKTENGYRICKEYDTSIHSHLKNLNPSYKLIDNDNLFAERFYISSTSLHELENIKTSKNKTEDIKYKARKLSHLSTLKSFLVGIDKYLLHY